MTDELTLIGKPLPKVDALGKVTGETKYADDLAMPRMLHAKILGCHYPHARIKHIGTARAQALPGVVAIITGADLPVKYGNLPVSQDETGLAGDKGRFVGDPIAAVAAVDEETAERAIDLIDVEYEELPAFMSVEDVLTKEGEPIQDYGDQGNVHKMVALEFGDTESGFAAADYVREDTFFYQGNTHLPMEEHAVVAHYTADGKLTLWSSTQCPHYVHRALSKALAIAPSRVRIIATPVGGGFGGKSDPLPHEVAAAKLSMITGRPVKIALTREEVFYAHRGRHPVLMWAKTGVRKDGSITAMHFKTFLDGGAYGSYGVASTYYTGALQPVTYKVPTYKFEGMRAFTNKPACGPKRGHGTPQPRFGMEIQLDKIAEAIGISPVDIRRKFVVDENSYTVNHLRITSCALGECIDKVAAASGFNDKHRKLPFGKGVGLACSSYLSGAGLPIYWNNMPHTSVQIKIDRGGGVAVLCGSTDIGQGSNSVLAYTVAEVLGVSLDAIQLTVSDTDLTPIDLGSYSSRVTFMMGNAAIEAASKLKKLIMEAAAEKLQLPVEALAAKNNSIYCIDDERRSLTFAQAAQLAEAKHGGLGAMGSYTPPKLAGPFRGSGVGPSPAYSYSACVAQVDVDPETGEIKVEKIWIAHDCGRAINPLLVIGQTEGSVYMGLGEALMEEQDFRRNQHKIPSLLDYKSLTMMDMPEVETILVEPIDPEGPFGAKEAGQGPLLPVPPAVANAVYDAVGVRIDELPITADKVLKALALKAEGKEPRVGPKGVPSFVFPEPVRVEPHPQAPKLRGA
ncbi:MAG: aldehyde oxidase [Chloroflexi bacterium]|nr:aldehyde oxidase [Chloroflexota bacterium]